MHVPVAEISTKVELAIILAQTVPCYMPIPLSPSDLMGHESIATFENVCPFFKCENV
jgi:hypothetical protein